MEWPWKPRLKVGIIGDYGSGKSCFMYRFVKGSWSEFVEPTVGVDGATKEITIDSQSCIAVVFDTAGTKRS